MYYVVTAGILLLSNRFVPLALLLLAMDIVNITPYHILLDPRNWIVVPIVITLWIILSINYKSSFTPLFTVKTKGVYSQHSVSSMK
jgi:hypothetical protein